MYLPKQDDNSNPYRDARREKPRGLLFKICVGYIPAFVLFLVIRMVMLSYGVTVISFGVVDSYIADLMRDLRNWYLLRVG